jgi:hypothetical protein
MRPEESMRASPYTTFCGTDRTGRAYASIVRGARPRSIQICGHVAACSCRPNTGHFALSTTVPLKPSPKSVVAPREHHHPGRFHVTFKMLKRQMYGRAGPDLLRRRVLLAD